MIAFGNWVCVAKALKEGRKIPEAIDELTREAESSMGIFVNMYAFGNFTYVR